MKIKLEEGEIPEDELIIYGNWKVCQECRKAFKSESTIQAHYHHAHGLPVDNPSGSDVEVA